MPTLDVTAKLLGVDVSNGDPSPFDILGLSPRDELDDRVIQQAIDDRKKFVRQQVRGPQFMPYVRSAEQLIEQAATVLRELQTPTGAAGDASSSADEQIEAMEPTMSDRPRQWFVDIVKESVHAAVDADGTLSAKRRAVLVAQLREMEIPVEDIERLLARIPQPLIERVGSPERAKAYFVATVDLGIQGGVLPVVHEERLYDIARQLKISKRDARRVIRRRLRQKDASFESLSDAAATLNDELTPDEAVGLTRVLLPVITITILIAVIIGLRNPEWFESEPDPITQPDPPAPRAVQPAVVTETRVTQPSLPGLAYLMMAAVHHPQQVIALANQNTSTEVAVALESISQFLFLESYKSDSLRARHVFQALLESPTRLYADRQVAAVNALIDRLRDAQDGKQAAYPTAMLARVILLRRSHGVDLDDSAARAKFVADVNARWNQCIAALPSDPLHAPDRMLQAILEGGSLTQYTLRSGPGHFRNVAFALVHAAAMPLDYPTHVTGWNSLHSIATRTDARVPQFNQEQAKLALSHVIRTTKDVAVASKTYQALVDLVGMPSASPPSDNDWLNEDYRHESAAMFERMINPQFEVPRSGPSNAQITAMIEQMTKQQAVDEYEHAGSKIDQVRRKLTRTAANLLACCDRAAQFAHASSPWSDDLDSVLDSNDQTYQLIRHIDLASVDYRRAVAKDSIEPLTPERVRELEDQLYAPSTGVRYRAIEVLRVSNSPDSAKVLLDAFTRVATATPVNLRLSIRMLNALATMTDESILDRLVELVGATSDSFLAYKIVETLQAGARLAATDELVTSANAKLGYPNLAGLRKATSAWWSKQLQRSLLSWRPVHSALGESGDDVDGSLWMPDTDSLKLLVAITLYMNLAAEELQPFRWDDTSRLPSPNESVDAYAHVPPGSDLGSDLLTAARRLHTQLDRLVRQHPSDDRFAVQADVVQLNMRARIAASETDLQKLAVMLDGHGALLELLAVQTEPSDAERSILETISQQRKQAIAGAMDVVEELHQCAYYNLALWGLMLR